MSEVKNNNVYLTLNDKNSDEFILKHNLEFLIQDKNATIEQMAHALVSIPAALVQLKWKNRREIYAYQVKEEIYGAAIAEIIARKPELKEKIMARIESNYQHILSRETATLRLTRKLSDSGHRTSNINKVAPKEKKPAPATVKASTSSAKFIPGAVSVPPTHAKK